MLRLQIIIFFANESYVAVKKCWTLVPKIVNSLDGQPIQESNPQPQGQHILVSTSLLACLTPFAPSLLSPCSGVMDVLLK